MTVIFSDRSHTQKEDIIIIDYSNYHKKVVDLHVFPSFAIERDPQGGAGAGVGSGKFCDFR